MNLDQDGAMVVRAGPQAGGRVEWREHGIVVAGVSSARHGSWFTRAFEEQVA